MLGAKSTAIAAIAAAALMQGCSTMDKVNAQDWTPYSGTKAASQGSNPNAVDTASSAVADTVLLPITGISYAFGYRYDPSTHTMRQSANNWGWPSYPPAVARSNTSSTTGSATGTMGANGSTSGSTVSGTTGGTSTMGSSMSSGLSPSTGATGPSTTMGTTGSATTGTYDTATPPTSSSPRP